MSTTTFRLLYALAISLSIGSSIVDSLFPALLPAAAVAALEQVESKMFEATWALLVAGIWMVAILPATIGFWFFRRWARTLSVAVTAFTPCVALMVGPLLLSGLANALAYASYTLWGFVLAASFFGPVAGRFVGRSRRLTSHSNGSPAAPAEFQR